MSFWRTEADGTRWWLISPEGNKTRSIGLNSVDADADDWSKKFPSKAAWHDSIIDLMTAAGMNTVGSFGDEIIPGLASTPMIGFLGAYAEENNVAPKSTGAMKLLNNEKGFAKFCNERARVKCRPGDPELIAYLSDNELAWGAASNSQLRTYFETIKAAIAAYDTDHLFFGPRIHRPCFANEDLFRILGQHCDGFAVNYYGVTRPYLQQTARWCRWAGGIPYLTTEFYAMANRGTLDGLRVKNTSGAGAVVTTQTARAKWFKVFAERAREDINCVGYHWFRYMDDPTKGGSNKGVVGVKFSPYTELLRQMAETNGVAAT